MKNFRKICAFVARMTLPENLYNNLRSLFYSLRKRRASEPVSSDGFLEWYAGKIDSSAPNLSLRLSEELLHTGNDDLQLLKKHGLKKSNSLFEQGVGYMRATAYFVNFLGKGKFSGNDISSERIALGLKNNPQLSKKNPLFYHSSDNFFDFPEKRKYDFLYSNAVICHMPPDHIVEAFTNMRKNLMHGDSKLIFNYSVLDFENFLYDDEVPLNEILLRVERGTIGPSGGLLFTLLKEYQGKDMLTFTKTQFFHSRAYMESLVTEAGLRFEDISEPHFWGDASSSYYTRIVKAFI